MASVAFEHWQRVSVVLQEAESRALYQCLRAIFDRATEFGGGLFALAASVMTDLIHHDPLCFRELDAAGLPDAFIAAIKVSFPASVVFASVLAEPGSRQGLCACIPHHNSTLPEHSAQCQPIL